MKRLLISSLFVSAVLGLGLGQARAQGEATSPSLGDLARKLKAQRAQAGQKPKLYTNDNLPARPPRETLTVAAGMSATEPAQTEIKEGRGTTAQAEPAEEVRDEKYYRTRMSDLRAQLALHQRQLDVLQQKLSQNQMQFYGDPNKTLQQEFTRSDVNKLNQEVQKKQQEVAADEKAMEDLRDQVRRDGGDPGWVR